MSGGENKTIAIEPAGFIGIVVENGTKEGGPDFGATERETQMTGTAGVNGVEGETARFIGRPAKRLSVDFHKRGES